MKWILKANFTHFRAFTSVEAKLYVVCSCIHCHMIQVHLWAPMHCDHVNFNRTAKSPIASLSVAVLLCLDKVINYDFSHNLVSTLE